MLSPVDTHYLVGLLTLASEPEGVDVELGDMVLDQATEEERDVDITVTSKTVDGKMSVFKGIEVKDHRRPLDVTHVEQLCLKFDDAPAITTRAIVSASGYTRPAVLKAGYHNVRLFHLSPWMDPFSGLGRFHFPEEFCLTEQLYDWYAPPHVRINPDQQLSSEIAEFIANNPRVCDQSGNDLTEFKNLNNLALRIAVNALDRFQDDPAAAALEAGTPYAVQLNVEVTDSPCIDVRGQMMVIEKAVGPNQVIILTIGIRRKTTGR